MFPMMDIGRKGQSSRFATGSDLLLSFLNHKRDNRMRKLLLAFAATALLSGCASDAVPVKQAVTVPGERVFDYQEPAKSDSSITIVRDSGMVGGGCYITVFLNGARVAKLDTKEKATFYVNSGAWIVGAGHEGKGLCSGGKERQERDVIIRPGEEKYLRVFTDNNGNVDIKPTTIQ